MVRPGVSTATVTRQGAAVAPGGQAEPAAAEVAVLMITLSPVSGSLTVIV